jgi:ABC-type nickel/cobalt efflux system permease component RcnA
VHRVSEGACTLSVCPACDVGQVGELESCVLVVAERLTRVVGICLFTESCMDIHVHAHTHTCTHTFPNVDIHSYKKAHLDTHTHIHTCTHTHIHIKASIESCTRIQR